MSASEESEVEASDSAQGLTLSAFMPVTSGQLVAMVLALLFLGGAVTYAASAVAEDSRPAAGSVDVGFFYDMVTHHRQALQMSNAELMSGAEPGMEVFAREILSSQSYEIGLMEQKLGEWGYGRDSPPDQAMVWMGMPVDRTAMPGMASEAEMEALRTAEGRPTDALFAQLMQDHHRGGAAMAEFAAENASDPYVREIASRMATNQLIEIQEMQAAVARAGLDVDPPGYVPADVSAMTDRANG